VQSYTITRKPWHKHK